MTASSSAHVDEFVAKLGQPHCEIVAGLRKVIKAAAPDIEERISWGMPCYFHNGMVCGIMSCKAHVNLQLIKGARLTDPRHLLEGTGKGMRHLKLRTPAEIPVARVKRWIRESLALNAPPQSDSTSSKRRRG
jgi:hypothetical protein